MPERGKRESRKKESSPDISAFPFLCPVSEKTDIVRAETEEELHHMSEALSGKETVWLKVFHDNSISFLLRFLLSVSLPKTACILSAGQRKKLLFWRSFSADFRAESAATISSRIIMRFCARGRLKYAKNADSPLRQDSTRL